MSKYQPSNGMEGADFMEAFCCRCEKGINQDCPILASTMRYKVTDPEYPEEWQYDETTMSGAHCTAFKEVGFVLVFKGVPDA